MRSVSPSFLGVFLCCFVCVLVLLWFLVVLFGFVLEDTWLFALTYSPTRGNSQTKTIRFDDRLSLERARHELKKKRHELKKKKGSWSFSLLWGVKANVCMSNLWGALFGLKIMKPLKIVSTQKQESTVTDSTASSGISAPPGLDPPVSRAEPIRPPVGSVTCQFQQKCQYCTFPCCRCDTLHVLHRCKQHVNW